MENTNNTSEESVHPERGTERAVSEDVAEGEDTPVVTVDPNGGTELGVNEDNVEDWETEDETDDEDGEEDDDDEEGDSSDEDSGEETEDYEFEEDEEEDGDTETCPICLDRLRDQDVGTPESCDHVFCLDCIQEWAKNVNTCPVDRQVFHLIFARHAGKDAIFKKITVEDKEQDDPDVEEDPIFCEACGRSDREDRLLLCDGCDLGYHCECLNPPLAEVPAEEWYCPDCEALQDREREGEAAVTVSDDEEIYHIIQEAGVLPHSLRPRVHRRQVARTRMSDRIYRQIQEIRRSRFNRRMIILSDSESSDQSEHDLSDEDFDIDGDAPSTSTASAATRKKPTTRRKRKTRSRKTKVKRKSTQKRKGATGKSKKGKQLAGKKTKGKKTKRKTRRKKKSTSKRKGFRRKRVVRRRAVADTPVTTVKSRIAKSLGLSKPPTGRSIPLQKRPRDRTEEFGPAPLSIMGTPNDLFYFQDEAENQPCTSGYSSHSGKKPKMSSNLQFSVDEIMKRTPVVRIAADSSLRFRPQEENASVTSASGSTPCDLLGSIFQGQQMLHMNTNKIKIHRDGSLTAVKAETDPKEGGSKSTDSKDGKTQPGEGTSAEGGASSKEQGDSEVGTGSKFLRLPIFAGSSSVELDDKVELPEDPPEVPFQEDDGLGDSLWTIQKRQGQIELDESNPDGGRAMSEEQSEESDLTKNEDRKIEKSVSSDKGGENKSKVMLDQTSKSDKHRTPGKGKESKSRNYRSNQTLFTTHKSKKTDLYSDVDDSLDVPTSLDVFEKSLQDVGEKSKKHSEKTASSKVKVGDKSICSDMFEDRTQDSVSDLGKMEDLDDFKLEKSPKPGDPPTYNNPQLDDVKFEYEDSNDSVPSTSWSDAGIGSAIITQEQYSDKKWRLDKVQSMDQELSSKPSTHKSPRGSRRRSDSRGKEQDPGLLITVAGGSEDRSVAEKTEKNTEIYEQQRLRKNESDKESSKERREKSSSKSRSYHREDDSDHNKSKSRKQRSRSRSKERRRRSRSRERRERSRSRERRERSRSRERPDGSRSQQKLPKSKDKRERSRSIEHKSRERHERSRSWERKEGSKSRENRQRSRSRERRKSKRDRSRSVERRRERSRSSERRRDRSRSVERKHDQHKQEQTRSTERHRDRSRSVERRQSTDEGQSRSMERSSKKSRREKSNEKRKSRDSRDLIASPQRQDIEERLEQEEKLDVFSYGIKRLHDGKNKKKKKLKTTETEPIVILSDDELDSTPKMRSDRTSIKQKTNSNDRDLNRIEPIITARSSSNHHTKDKSETREPPLPTEEVIQPPMPQAISNVIKVLTNSKEPKRSKSRHKEVEDIFLREEAKTKESERHRSFDEEMEDRSFEEECAYDPAFPTVDMEESPTEDQPIVLEEAAEPIQMTVNPLLHKELPMQSISPLPGPPPPPMPGQGLLGEPSILLPTSAGEPPQSMLPGTGQQIPLQLRMLAPGFAAQQPGGLPPQRQLIMNHPVFINRPGSFPHLQQLPAGHPLHPRLVSTPGGMVTMQNQFPPRIPSLVSVPGQHGLLNGALDHLSHDPHLILTSDPHGDPRLHHPHPPHPEHRVISIRPEVPVVPMSVHDNMPLSIASSEALSMNQPNIIPSVSQLEQISQITKLLNTQAQLAMFGKESKGLEHHEHKQEPMEQKNSNNVFKVPLPPILTHTLNKVKSEKENMEMVDMDMSSPQDNGNIEIPTSSSEKSERSRRRDKKRSHRHRQDRHRTNHEDRHRSSHEDSVTSTVEKTYDQIMDEMNSVDEIPSSAVELTNKEKYLRKLHLQERVVDEVKTALKPFYSAKKVNKEQYKEILRRAVPKVCHSKSGDINPVKIRALVDAYVAKFNRNMSPPKDENEDQPKKAQ